MKPPRWDHLLRDQNPDYHLVGAFGTNYTQSEIGVLFFCVNRSTVDFIIPIKLEISSSKMKNRRDIKIDIHHSYNFWIYCFCEHSSASSDVVNNLIKCSSFDLLALEVCHGVHEVEAHAALSQLPDEQLLLLRAGHV